MPNKYLKNTILQSILALFTLIICLSCQQQISPKGNTVPSTVNSNTSAVPQREATTAHSAPAIRNTQDTAIVNQYHEGKKEGLWQQFHHNGQLASAGNYKLGLKEGLHQEWQEDGTLLLEGLYKNGKADGWMKWFHERGHLAAAGNMIAGTRVGPWKICDVQENGFCIEAHFKDGTRDGIWKIFHEHAPDKLWKEQTWKADKVVSEKCWDERGVRIDCK